MITFSHTPVCIKYSGKNTFHLLSLGWYLFTVLSHNGYLTTGSSRNAHSITTNGNVFVASCVISGLSIPFLDFLNDSLNWLTSVKLMTKIPIDL